MAPRMRRYVSARWSEEGVPWPVELSQRRPFSFESFQNNRKIQFSSPPQKKKKNHLQKYILLLERGGG